MVSNTTKRPQRAPLLLLCQIGLALGWSLQATASQAAVREAPPSTGSSKGTPVVAPEARAPKLDSALLFAHPALITGDDTALRADLFAALEADPGGALALEAVHLLDWHADAMSPDEVARLLGLAWSLPDAEASFQARRMAEREAARLRFSDAPISPEVPFGAGFVGNWYVVGPLGALDHRAPRSMEAPASSPELSGVPDAASYMCMDGRERQWQRYDRLDAVAWSFVPADLVYPTGGVTYAAAYLKVADDEDRRALVELRTGGAFRAWWNGAPLHDVTRAKAADNAVRFLSEVDVQPGWNVLMVRVVTSERAELGARLLDVQGRQLRFMDMPPTHAPAESGEAAAAPVPPLALAPNARSTQVAAPAPRSTQRSLLSDADAAGPASDPYAAALACMRGLIDRRPDRALAVSGPTEPAARAAWRGVRLRALNASTHLPEEVERRLTLELLDAIEAEGVPTELARAMRIRQFQREDRPLEALALAEAWSADAPLAVEPRLYRAACLGQIDRAGVLRRMALSDLVRDFPRHAAARMALASARESAGDEVGAYLDAWEVLRLDATNEDALALVLRLTERCGDVARVEFLLQRTREWRSRNPDDAVARDLELSLLDVLGRGDEALALVEGHRDHAGIDPDQHWIVGERLLGRGNVDGARRSFQRELALDPADPTTRTTVRLLGEVDPTERFFEAFAPNVEAALARAESVVDASVVDALDSGLVYFFPDGSAASRFHTLSVPRDRTGTEALHVHPIEAGTRRARILARDGRELEPIEVDGDWTLPALEPGDVVEFVWDSFASGVPGAPPPERGWRFSSFEKAFPTSRWVVFVPDGLPGRLDVRNFDGTHETTRWENGTVHVLVTSQPRQIEEPLRPSDIEVLPCAAYGGDLERADELLAWESLVARLSELSDDLVADVDAFVAAHAQATPAATAEALFVALDERVRDQRGEAQASLVWLSQRGLTLFLLGALYERAGVPFEWAALERGIAPELDPEPVTAFANQRPLERAALRLGASSADGEPVWVIPTGAPGFAFGAIPNEMAGAVAWVHGAGGWRRETLPRSQLAESWDADVELRYTLAQDGSADVRGRFVMSTAQGNVLRRQLGEATAKQRDAFARQRVNAVARGLDLTRVSVLLDSDEPGTILEFEGRMPRFVTARGGEFVADPPFLPLGLDKSFGPAERTWPLVVRDSSRIRVRATLDLGAAWELLGGPTPMREERRGLTVSTSLEGAAPGPYALEQLYLMRGLEVAPEGMPTFLARMGELEQEFRRPLRFQRRDG
ncbi:MAG: hypothetical protein R3F49_16655 [Planctomycetota bacterium]